MEEDQAVKSGIAATFKNWIVKSAVKPSSHPKSGSLMLPTGVLGQDGNQEEPQRGEVDIETMSDHFHSSSNNDKSGMTETTHTRDQQQATHSDSDEQHYDKEGRQRLKTRRTRSASWTLEASIANSSSKLAAKPQSRESDHVRSSHTRNVSAPSNKRRVGAVQGLEEQAKKQIKQAVKSQWAREDAQRPKSLYYLKEEYQFLFNDARSFNNFEILPRPSLPRCPPPPTDLLSCPIGIISDLVPARQPRANARKAPAKYEAARVELPFEWFDPSHGGEQAALPQFRMSNSSGNFIPSEGIIKYDHVVALQYMGETFQNEHDLFVAMVRDAARNFFQVWNPQVLALKPKYFDYVRSIREWETKLLRQTATSSDITFPFRKKGVGISAKITVFEACMEDVIIDEHVRDFIGSQLSAAWAEEIRSEPWFEQ